LQFGSVDFNALNASNYRFAAEKYDNAMQLLEYKLANYNFMIDGCRRYELLLRGISSLWSSSKKWRPQARYS
jgi:hypothetical protein